MPEISRFLGIVIAMFYEDHMPPHVHVRYGEHRAVLAIGSLAIVAGSLPPRVLGLVAEWGALHRAELEEDWRLAQAREALRPIPPLE